MKTAKILITGMTISIICFISCRKDPLKAESAKEAKVEEVSIKQDSLETMYMMQSNPELMLADRIISKNSVFYLDMSQEEAQQLKISNELYQKYQKRVSEMNNTPEYDKNKDK